MTPKTIPGFAGGREFVDLTDEEVDAILAGEMEPPTSTRMKQLGARMVFGVRHCRGCHAQGHDWRNCPER